MSSNGLGAAATTLKMGKQLELKRLLWYFEGVKDKSVSRGCRGPILVSDSRLGQGFAFSHLASHSAMPRGVKRPSPKWVQLLAALTEVGTGQKELAPLSQPGREGNGFLVPMIFCC